ncbi:MAG: transcriptional regulator [Candidatus Sumerlaeaceae bacterium]|nr:transcriptional regulator [Candidatus Sumerlaeaceae bacterium]
MREETYTRHWRILCFILDSRRGKLLSEIRRDLADHGFHVVERTVRRDLQALQLAGFPVISEKVERGTVWTLTKDYRNLPPTPFGLDEAFAMLVARSVLEARGHGQLARQISGIVDKLTTKAAPEFREIIARLEGSVYCKPLSRAQGGAVPGYYDQIAQAIQEQKKLRVTYRSAAGRLSKGRLLAPIRLWIDNQQTYLIAYCYQRADVRMFLLGRFEAMEVTDERFEVTWKFDAEQFASESFGVFRTTPEVIELEFDDMLSSYFDAHPLHPTQRLSRRDGRWKIQLRVGINESLIHRLLGFGHRVRVVKPRALADLLVERHRQAIAAYEALGGESGAQQNLPLGFE